MRSDLPAVAALASGAVVTSSLSLVGSIAGIVLVAVGVVLSAMVAGNLAVLIATT